MGPQTEQAVASSRIAYGISTSGRIDNQTLYALGQTQLASERSHSCHIADYPARTV